VVLAFSHDGRAWRKIHGVDERDVQPDANGVPKVLTTSGRTVIAVVESTNPLVYEANAGAITETDAAVVADVRKLFELLGPSLTEVLKLARALHGEGVPSLGGVADFLEDCLPNQWTRARRFTQHVEDHEAGEYGLLARREKCSDLDAVLNSLEDLLGTIEGGIVARGETPVRDTGESAAAVTAASLDRLRATHSDIKKFERRLVESAATYRPIRDGTFRTSDVADFFVVPRGSIVVAWTKQRSRTLTVAKASPFEKLSTNRPDSVSTSYGAASLAASLVDLNVALTYTPLSSPVFGRVSEPAPTAADPGATESVIRQTDEDSRAGELAVLVSLPVFLPMGDSSAARRFALELGAGADTSTPALFLGLSARLHGGVRLGVGVTSQQVKALKGQSEGDPIGAATDIQLEDVWDTEFYASFSFSLESIGDLFRAP